MYPNDVVLTIVTMRFSSLVTGAVLDHYLAHFIHRTDCLLIEGVISAAHLNMGSDMTETNSFSNTGEPAAIAGDTEQLVGDVWYGVSVGCGEVVIKICLNSMPALDVEC